MKRKVKPSATPLERMTELTRRLVAVPKSEIQKPKRRKRSIISAAVRLGESAKCSRDLVSAGLFPAFVTPQ